ncbi:neuraminidase-like domain-containing protein [Pseudomonas sp. NPDC087029]|uniref:Tc toxin subunit A-related protein n=1 Tax=Pseudomonas sp. NPDC087029 TaxID=3364433 RepID=UPI003817CC6B
MARHYSEQLQSLIDNGNCASLACLGEYSLEELREQLGDEAHTTDLTALHNEIRGACDLALIEKKNAIIGASPLLPSAMQDVDEPPIEALPEAAAATGALSTRALQAPADEVWRQDRARQYCSPGDVGSMFSPAAYLTTLYRQARMLYPEQNPWHIDQRRPDLKQLLLGQENLDTPLSALSLSNEILLSRARRALAVPGSPESSDEQLLQALASDVGTSGTPYHLQHNRLRQVLALRDEDFSRLHAAPQFAKHLDDTALACLRHDIPPALLRKLLTDVIDASNADEKFTQYFPGVTPESMLQPARLRSWFGLSDAQLQGFMGALDNGQYEGNSLTTRVENEVVKLTLSGPSSFLNYVRLFPLGNGSWQLAFNLKVSRVVRFVLSDAFSLDITAADFGVTELLPNTEYRQRFEWKDVPAAFTLRTRWVKSLAGGGGGHSHPFNASYQRLSAAAHVLALNKLVRLYKATGLSMAQLQDILQSVDPTEITDQTLAVIYRTGQLVARYGIDHQHALLMARGLISEAAGNGEKSQFDRLFNDPPLVEGGFSTSTTLLSLHPSQARDHADIKATLKRACQVDDEGLYELGRLMNGGALSNISVKLDLSQLSGIYALSLWARHHGLAPGELRQLLQMRGVREPMQALNSDGWQRLLQELNSTCDWMRERGWTVQDLHLMTRAVDTIPASTEIVNLLNDLKGTLDAAQLPSDPTVEGLIDVLSPRVMSTFNLSSDALAKALLMWANLVEPGELTLQQACKSLRETAASASPARNLVDFAFGLAQMALIVHACEVKGDVLRLLVEKPALLSARAADSAGVVLRRDVQTIVSLGNFSVWLTRLADPAGAGGALLGEMDRGVALSQLAMAAGVPLQALQQAAKAAHDKEDLRAEDRVCSWQEIEVLLQWASLAQAYGVMPATLSALLALDDDWGKWQPAADALQASLTPTQAKVAHAATERPFSLALTGVLTARENFTVQGLNQHLLLDVLNTEQVISSRIAEALAALQQFIHRTLSTPEDPQAVRQAVLSRQFFLDWTRWNATYATWAAGQMLMYYPENYIDPTLRLGQTQAMDDMLQALGQAQINDDTVGDAFHGYLSAFEEVANLETISAYHDSREADRGKCWFVGRSRGEPRHYWWRTVNEAKRGAQGVFPANAWSAWSKIELAPQVQGRLIRPVVFKGRLHLGWVERQEQVITRSNNGQPAVREWRWSFKLAWLRYDGKWSAPIDYPLSVDANEPARLERLSLFLSAWPEREGLLMGIYDRVQGTAIAGLHILEDFSGNALAIAPFLGRVQHWLDTAGETGTCAVFDGLGVPQAELRMPVASGSAIPAGFNSFAAQLHDARVSEVDDATYSLSLRTQLSIRVPRPAVANPWVAALVERYPVLATASVQGLVRSGHGAFLVHKEAGHDWGYLCISSERMRAQFADASALAGISDGVSNALDYPLHEEPTAAGRAFIGRYRIVTANYPLTGLQVRFSTRGATGYVHRPPLGVTQALAYPGGFGQETIAPRQYVFSQAKVPAAQVFCRIYSVDNRRYRTVHATRDYDLATGQALVTFNTTARLGNVAEWEGGSEALHRIQFQFGNGNTRFYTLKVYKDGDVFKTAIIGTTGQGAQYLAHRGYMSRLNTLFARELTVRAVTGIDTILSHDTQQIAEPDLGVLVRLTLPPHKAAAHGAARWARVLLVTAANTRTELWLGELRNNAVVQADVLIESAGVYGTEQAYHLEIQYSAKHYQARENESIVIHSQTLQVLRDSDVRAPSVEGNRLSKDAVLSVQAFGHNTSNRMDFTGANALYFWELFYYTPMLVMQRFLQEERFDLAEQWLKHVYDPAGSTQAGSAQRMWKVRPLEENSSWNDEPLLALDPDAVAQNNPVHYKLNVFMRLLDIGIGRGDAAYRKLQRDTLSEASSWYQRALSLLGDAPWTPPNSTWVEPMLGQAAAADASSQFLPEVNRVMLDYWEGLRIRQYNLRHNLTLDGQPLNLPLYATPADPKALLAAEIAAQAGGERGLPQVNDVPALRFSVLLEGARSMAAQLMQFGSTLQGILEHQDAEALAGLLASQGAELADSNVGLYKQTLKELAAERATLESSLAAATLSRDYYLGLYQGNISDRENQALKLQTASGVASAGEAVAMAGSAVVAAFPNIFGLANGGQKPEEALKAVAYGLSTQSKMLGIAATRITQEEIYARRRADWKFQYQSAQKQMATVEAQLQALTVRETSAQMQVAHLQTQAAHAQAQLALYQGKFTGKAMYSWLRARLASIFYTYYDLAVSRCLMAQKALQWEKGDNATYLRTGTWNSAWAGLLCGEGLMLALGQMESAWTKWHKRELEVTRTVSLAKLFEGKLKVGTEAVGLGAAVKAIVAGHSVQVEAGSLALAAGEVLSIQFDLKALNLAAGFETAAARRIRSIAVSLPALLGPYQDVHARLLTNAQGLPVGCEQCSISHAVQDTGQFSQLNGYPFMRQGAQLLPFEGLHIAKADDPADQTTLTLNFAQAKGEQRALLERLSDIILHVQFTVR